MSEENEKIVLPIILQSNQFQTEALIASIQDRFPD